MVQFTTSSEHVPRGIARVVHNARRDDELGTEQTER